jgi:ATP-dependent Clp protease ATP-binding subunit ClpA
VEYVRKLHGKARRAIFFAHYEASQFGSPNIETEHLLLGLLHEAHTADRRFLGSEISRESIREEIKAHKVMCERTSIGLDLPFTNECKRALAYAAEEAHRLGNKHIGTEHLLLGLLREEDSFAARMLQRRGVELEQIRKEISVSPPRIHSGQSDRESLAVSERPVGETETAQPVERRHQPRQSFEHYTERARCALFFARFEASQFGTSSIETEHLLLGLLREGKAHLRLFVEPVSALESIRRQLEMHTPHPHGINIPMSVDLPPTEECRRALSCGAEEAQRLQRELIGPEHLLMGILREEQSFAAQMLRERGADLEETRKKLAEHSHTP